MASLTEQATLKLVDKSTPQIRKINAELKKLFATARSLKSVTVNFKINTSGIDKATAALGKLNAAAKKAQGSTAISTPAITRQLATHTRQVNQAAAATQRLHQQQQRIQRQAAAAGGGGGAGATRQPRQPRQPPQQPPQQQPPRGGSGGRGGGRTPTQAGLAGFAGGFGMGLSRLGESFGAVSLAGFAAAKALSAVAGQTMKADRAALAVETLTSEAQQKVFKEQDALQGAPKGALKHKRYEFDYTRATLAGDVGNSDDLLKAGRTALRSEEAQKERAMRADALTRHLWEKVAPGLYSRDPNMTAEGAIEEMRKFTQATGIATTEMFKTQTKAERAAGKMPELSEDFTRATEGFRLAQIADPGITPGMLKTAMANVKSLGMTMTKESIAEALLGMGTKGQRAMNETFRSYILGTGATDVKKVNEALAGDLGLYEPGTVKRNKPTKAFPKGSVQAGSGIPLTFKDAEGQDINIGERPAEWWRAAYKAKSEGGGGMIADIQKRNAEQAMAKAKSGGAGSKAVKAAGEAARAAIPSETQIADYLQTKFSGANKSAIQGVVDAILGKNILASQLAQAETAPDPDKVNAIAAQHYSTAADNLVTGILSAMGDVGEKIANKIDLNGILQGMLTKVENNPGWATIGVVAGPIIAVGIVSAVTTALGAGMAAGLGIMFRGLIPAIVRTVLGGGAAAATAGAVARGTIAGGAAGAARVAGLLNPVGGAVITGAMLLEYVLGTSPDKMRDDMIKAAANKQTGVLQGLIAGVQKQMAELSDMGDSSSFDQPGLDKLKVRLAELQEKLKVITDLTTPPAAEPAAAEDPQKAVQAAVDKAMAELKKNQPVTPAMTAAATPENVSALQKLIPELAKTADSITVSVKGLTESSTSYTNAATAITTAGTTLSTAVSGLGTTATTFSTVFSTGATAIANAGTSAADTLSGRAPGIGEQIGAAAAKAISAAAAQVSINVNHTGEAAPNTGRSAP